MIDQWAIWLIDHIPAFFSFLALVAIVICTPLCFFRRTRRFAGGGFGLISALSAVLSMVWLFLVTVAGLGWPLALVLCFTGIAPLLSGIYFEIQFSGLSGLIDVVVMGALTFGAAFAAAKLPTSKTDLR